MDIKLKTNLLNPIYSLLMSTPQAQQGPRMVLAQQGPRMVLAQQGPRMVLVVKIGFFMKWFSIIIY